MLSTTAVSGSVKIKIVLKYFVKVITLVLLYQQVCHRTYFMFKL